MAAPPTIMCYLNWEMGGDITDQMSLTGERNSAVDEDQGLWEDVESSDEDTVSSPFKLHKKHALSSAY